MMQRSKKGLSTVVGAIFLVAIIFAGISVINWGVGLQDNYALTISERNQMDWERLNEKVELTDLSIDNNKFNITLQNTGTLPARLVRLWVTNETSNWHEKYDINYLVNPTTKLTNLGQSLSLNALSTQDYAIGVVTERGNLATFRAASPSNQALQLNLHALPATVSGTFRVTLMLEVKNNLTDVNIINRLTPIQDLQLVNPPAGSSAVKISGPDPAFEEGLLRGDTAFFKWIYEVDGSDNDILRFNATLQGARQGNYALADVEISSVEVAKLAIQSEGSLSAASLSPNLPDPDGVLYFHQETVGVPSGNNRYQMHPMPPDQTNAMSVTLQNAGDKISFFTKNATESINIPLGSWNLTAWYKTTGGNASIKISYNVTDSSGNSPSNLYQTTVTVNSGTVTSYPHSANIDSVNLSAQQRLMVTLERVSGTFTLYFDTDARDSKLRTPTPDPNYPIYLNYNGGIVTVTLKNDGNVPIWLRDDTRVVFEHVSQAKYYTGIITDWQDSNGQNHSINTSRDSLIISPTSTMTLVFSTPRSQPAIPNTGNVGEDIVSGTYDVWISVNGYDVKGAIFLDIIPVGIVTF